MLIYWYYLVILPGFCSSVLMNVTSLLFLCIMLLIYSISLSSVFTPSGSLLPPFSPSPSVAIEVKWEYCQHHKGTSCKTANPSGLSCDPFHFYFVLECAKVFIQGGGAVLYLCQKRIQPRTNGANDEYRPIIDKTLGKTGVSCGFGQATKNMA